MSADPCVLPPTLRMQNAAAATTIKQALSAVYHLDDAGATVEGLAMRGDRAVIEILPPPAGYITGSLRKRITVGGVTRSWYTTRVFGVQVEWQDATAAQPRTPS